MLKFFWAFIMLTLISCQKELIIPFDVEIINIPQIGDTSIYLNFRIESNETSQGKSERFHYSWDFNGDNTWDLIKYGATSVLHNYSAPGMYNLKVTISSEGYQPKTLIKEVMVLGKNSNLDTLFDNRDSTSYRIVKIQDRWWMSENLKFGVSIEVNKGQADNSIVEYYICGENEYGINPTTAVYGWNEAMNYQLESNRGICPNGWHIPSDDDWKSLFSWLPALTNKQRRHYLNGEYSGLELSNGLYFGKPQIIDESTNIWMHFSSIDWYWSSSWHKTQDVFFAHFSRPLSSNIDQIKQDNFDYHHATVRCIKDR